MATRRRGSARRRGRPSRDWEKVGGVALGSFAVLAVAALVIFRAIADPAPRDPVTLCPEDGPSQVTAIFVDTTDRVGSTSREDILGRLDDLVSDSQPDEMMLVYDTSWSPTKTVVPLLTVCNPGDPDAADPLISSPELIRQRLEDYFKRPLAKLFEELLDAEEATVSPLMETIQAISVTVLARQRYADVPKRVILISDLMQHSKHLSLYRDPLNYDAFAQTAGAEALRTNLQNVLVRILFVPRRAHSRLGNTIRLIEFWERWIDSQRGELERASRIDGLN